MELLCIHANKSSHLPGTAFLDEPGLPGDGRILKHAHTCSLQQRCCSFLPGRSRVWVQAEGNLHRPFFPPPVLQISMEHGGFFLYHSCQWGIPKAAAQFLMQTELENGRCFFFFFLIPWFEIQIYEPSFLESIFTAGTKNCTISHSGVWPWTICEIKWRIAFFIYIDVHVDALSCVLRLCQRLKSLVNEDFQYNFKVCPRFCCFFLTTMLCSNCFCETEGTDTLSCLSLLRGQSLFIKETSNVASCWCL